MEPGRPHLTPLVSKNWSWMNPLMTLSWDRGCSKQKEKESNLWVESRFEIPSRFLASQHRPPPFVTFSSSCYETKISMAGTGWDIQWIFDTISYIIYWIFDMISYIIYCVMSVEVKYINWRWLRYSIIWIFDTLSYIIYCVLSEEAKDKDIKYPPSRKNPLSSFWQVPQVKCK